MLGHDDLSRPSVARLDYFEVELLERKAGMYLNSDNTMTNLSGLQ